MGDEELASVGARAGIGHGQATRAVMAKARIKFIFKAIAGSARARAQGATTLNHEIGDDTVKA